MSFKELPLPSIASLRAVAALRSVHLAPVRPARIGLGFEATTTNQKSLAEVERTLGGPGRLSLPYSLRWLLDVMAGVGVLHRSLGFVHGELQPEHVVLGEDGMGRLVPVVRAHWVRGEQRAPETLYYLAPEKLLGDGIDPRADVFSAGVLLWEAITGQRMMEAYTVEDVIARLMGGGIPRARAPEGEVWTAPLALIAERAIAVDPARRFATIGEMREAIEHATARYLASTPGMVALFQHPEQRLRGRPRDSFAPESQQMTVLPATSAPLEPAVQRLSRPHLSSVDLEEELTRPKVTLTAKEAASIAKPKPSESISAKSSLVDTLVGVQPTSFEQPTSFDRDSSPGDELTTPFIRVAPSEPAPTAAPRPAAGAAPVRVPAAAPVASVATRSPIPPHNPTPPYFRSPTSSLPPEPSARPVPVAAVAPVAVPPVANPSVPAAGAGVKTSRRSTMSSWPPPIGAAPVVVNEPPRAPWPSPVAPVAPVAPAPLEPPPSALPWPPLNRELPRAAPSTRPSAPQTYAHDAFDSSVELMRPRRGRAVLWVVLAAAAVVTVIAARPWLMRQLAAEHHAPPSEAPAAAPPEPLPARAAAATNVDEPAPSSSSAPSRAATSEPPVASPAPRVASGRGRAAREERIVIPDSEAPVAVIPPEVTQAPEPAPVVEPAPEPPPPPPPPPPPKPKAPVSDGDRYGI